jgi:hypothetical protein
MLSGALNLFQLRCVFFLRLWQKKLNGWMQWPLKILQMLMCTLSFRLHQKLIIIPVILCFLILSISVQ